MMTERPLHKQLPPICPFGSEEDAVEAVIGDSGRWVCWPLGNDMFLRVNTYENGEIYYQIASRQEVQETFKDNHFEDEVAIDAENRKRLRKMKLTRILRYIDK